MDTTTDVGRDGDFDNGRWTFARSSKNETTFDEGLSGFKLTMGYEKRGRAAAVGEPVAAGVQVGRYERTKKTLFGAMHKYCVTKKLEDGEDCCITHCDARERGDPPASFYLCENLHLLCKPCKNNWRIENDNKGCPACCNETEYAFVITPNASPLANHN
jgi:hypothetical protein